MWKVSKMRDEQEDIQVKAPQDVIFDVPQETFTGGVLRGYGPRRGNLERLLRYWRPIMKKPGGFRRCRVILANHPELYPLERICAWLHHETTGLWPNEGCHHPGMKNCVGKLRKLNNWNDSQFNSFMRSGFKKRPKNTAKGKSAEQMFESDVFFSDFNGYDAKSVQDVVTESDMTHAMTVLSEFMTMEEKFVSYLRDSDNWEIVGNDADGNEVAAPFIKRKSLDDECCS